MKPPPTSVALLIRFLPLSCIQSLIMFYWIILFCVNEIKIENEEITTGGGQILSTTEKDYSDLYSSNVTEPHGKFKNFVNNLEIPRLDGKEKDELEGLLTYEECKIKYGWVFWPVFWTGTQYK